MKIVNKSKNSEVTFNDIKVGDAFYYPHSGGIYMRTETMFDEDGCVQTNAVNLQIGTLNIFPFEYNVIPVKCECVIHDK